MVAKVRFSVSIDPKTNEAIEQLAKRYKPELSKSYLVEYALVRLLDAMDRSNLLCRSCWKIEMKGAAELAVRVLCRRAVWWPAEPCTPR